MRALSITYHRLDLLRKVQYHFYDILAKKMHNFILIMRNIRQT